MTDTENSGVKISVIIPAYRGGKELEKLVAFISCNNSGCEIIIVDTRSEESVVEMASKYGAKVIIIEKESFDHGYVRSLGGKAASGSILVYFTQDSIPINKEAIQKLVLPLLENKSVAVSYGRQLPHANASPFAAHLRLFNYPPESELKSYEDRAKLGIKAVFISNSFSAYRKSALEEIGWFKTGLPLGEDFNAGAQFLEKGYLISYTAGAEVFHSHNYTVMQEFKRYFDTGVLHHKEAWILKKFGKPEKEGVKFIFSEISYLLKTGGFYLIPFTFVRAAAKLLGYKLGYSYTILPAFIVEKCSFGNSYKRGD